MLKGVHYPKVRSLTTITLLVTLLISMMTLSAKGSPGIWLEYDRNDPDYAYSGVDALAVRFTPPRIWLGMGYTCALFKVTAIRLHLYCDSLSAGFDTYITDEDHQPIKSFLNQHPIVTGWYDLDLTGWAGTVESHFFVEFVASTPNPNLQETWAMLSFDEAEIDAGERSFGRSYINTYGPDNPNMKSWYPIEMIYPYTSGDLLVRVELEPKDPVSILPNLKEQILAADNTFFDGFENKLAQKMKRILIGKIDEAILMLEMGYYQDGLDKLVHDIGSKLADPRPTPATSWLHLYPEGSANQKLVTSFAVVCQDIIQMAQKSALPPGVPEHCDFNGDYYDDLAIGVPCENIGGKENAGAVNVLYGSPTGITEEQDQYWRQGIDGVEGNSEAGDRFGQALAIGNFNGDDYDDLAIGVPYEDLVTMEQDVIPDAGAVNILYGSPSGLTTEGQQTWWQNLISQVPGTSEAYDNFGATLAAGDFNDDGYDDLVIGVPSESNEDIQSGEVDVLYGSQAGLTTSNNQIWSQGILEGAPEYHDLFGRALTVGDFDGDGFEDLVIGVPNENIGDIEDAGAINVLYGSSGGLTVVGNQIWYQDSALIPDSSEIEDFFGASLAAGDFNGDNYDDLAVGVPGESTWAEGARALNILYGSSTGLTAEGFEIIEPDLFQDDGCVSYDYFGASLATGDFDQDGYEDLAIGIPRADVISGWTVAEDAGALSIIYGCSLGLYDSTRNDVFNEPDFTYDYVRSFGPSNFAAALTTGDFNGDGHCDLAVGAPRADPILHITNEAGAVTVMYGSETGLSDEDFNTWYQDKEGVDGDCEDYDYFGSSLPGSRWVGMYP